MTGFLHLSKHATNSVRRDIHEKLKARIPDEVIGRKGSVANNAVVAAEGVSTTTNTAMHDADDVTGQSK